MYIRDFTIDHIADDGYGYHPEVKLSFKNCTSEDLANIRILVENGFDMTVISTEGLRRLYSSIPLRYCAHDVVNTYHSLLNISNSTDDLKVTKVIYHNPATIVFWSDGTKTVVKCGKGDTYDKEKGFYIACAKKLFGNDYKAVGRMNKALEMAEDKNENDIKKTFDKLKKALEMAEDKNG